MPLGPNMLASVLTSDITGSDASAVATCAVV